MSGFATLPTPGSGPSTAPRAVRFAPLPSSTSGGGGGEPSSSSSFLSGGGIGSQLHRLGSLSNNASTATTAAAATTTMNKSAVMNPLSAGGAAAAAGFATASATAATARRFNLSSMDESIHHATLVARHQQQQQPATTAAFGGGNPRPFEPMNTILQRRERFDDVSFQNQQNISISSNTNTRNNNTSIMAATLVNRRSIGSTAGTTTVSSSGASAVAAASSLLVPSASAVGMAGTSRYLMTSDQKARAVQVFGAPACEHEGVVALLRQLCGAASNGMLFSNGATSALASGSGRQTLLSVGGGAGNVIEVYHTVRPVAATGLASSSSSSVGCGGPMVANSDDMTVVPATTAAEATNVFSSFFKKRVLSRITSVFSPSTNAEEEGDGTTPSPVYAIVRAAAASSSSSKGSSSSSGLNNNDGAAATRPIQWQRETIDHTSGLLSEQPRALNIIFTTAEAAQLALSMNGKLEYNGRRLGVVRLAEVNNGSSFLFDYDTDCYVRPATLKQFASTAPANGSGAPFDASSGRRNRTAAGLGKVRGRLALDDDMSIVSPHDGKVLRVENADGTPASLYTIINSSANPTPLPVLAAPCRTKFPSLMALPLAEYWLLPFIKSDPVREDFDPWMELPRNVALATNLKRK